MRQLRVRGPSSAGLLLSYKCTGECRHCMYASSPKWRADWISEGDLERVLAQLAGAIEESPHGPDGVGVNFGLHFTGGEPFLNFELLLKAVRTASRLGIPSTFVETNCFWCASDDLTRGRLLRLRSEGLRGLLVSANPFVVEHVPFERIERALRIGREVFGRNVIVYQELFFNELRRLGARGTVPFEDYLRRSPASVLCAELLPMGRAVYRLAFLYRRLPARRFFGTSCREELERGWHVHVDNYCNYVPGYCSGISLGDARDLDSLRQGVDLDDRPVLRALATDLRELYELGVREFGYRELEGGYVSKCHLCLDLRRHIVGQTDEFEELRPREFYEHLL